MYIVLLKETLILLFSVEEVLGTLLQGNFERMTTLHEN